MKQNSDAKLGFRLPTQTASQVVIDEAGLEAIESVPGRALFKTDRLTEIQVPYISNEQMWDVLRQYEVKRMHIQTHIKMNRQMMILTSIRRLKFATRRHLMAIHDMGGIRNANRILKDLTPYVNSTVYKKSMYITLINRDVRYSMIQKRLCLPLD